MNNLSRSTPPPMAKAGSYSPALIRYRNRVFRIPVVLAFLRQSEQIGSGISCQRTGGNYRSGSDSPERLAEFGTRCCRRLPAYARVPVPRHFRNSFPILHFHESYPETDFRFCAHFILRYPRAF